jgi:hypothetical protein
VNVRLVSKLDPKQLTDARLNRASGTATNSFPLLEDKTLSVTPSWTSDDIQAPRAMDEEQLYYERGETRRRKEECRCKLLASESWKQATMKHVLGQCWYCTKETSPQCVTAYCIPMRSNPLRAKRSRSHQIDENVMGSLGDQIKEEEGDDQSLIAPCVMSIVHEVVHNLTRKIRVVGRKKSDSCLLARSQA